MRRENPRSGKQTMSDVSGFGGGGSDRKRGGMSIVNAFWQRSAMSAATSSVATRCVQTLNPMMIDAAFRPLDDALKGAPPEAVTKLAALKSEAGKGKEADDGVVAKLLDGLVGNRA